MEGQTPQEQPTTRHERRAIKKEAAAQELNRSFRRQKIKRWSLGFGAIIIVAAAVWGLGRAVRPALEQATEPLAACVNHTGVGSHTHAALRIIANGAPQEIPANVGVAAGCMRPVHTHDASGTIHMEYLVPHDFTLGDFFTVWNRPFSRDRVFDFVVDDGHELIMTVDGERVDTYEETVLRDDQEIVIEHRDRPIPKNETSD